MIGTIPRVFKVPKRAVFIRVNAFNTVKERDIFCYVMNYLLRTFVAGVLICVVGFKLCVPLYNNQK